MCINPKDVKKKLLIKANIKHYIYIHTRLLVWKIGENEDKLLLDEDLWKRFGWTTATKVTI